MSDFIVNNLHDLYDAQFNVITQVELNNTFIGREDLILDRVIYHNNLKTLGPQKTFKKFKYIPTHIIDHIIDTGSYLFMRKGKVSDKPYYIIVASEHITTI